MPRLKVASMSCPHKYIRTIVFFFGVMLTFVTLPCAAETTRLSTLLGLKPKLRDDTGTQWLSPPEPWDSYKDVARRPLGGWMSPTRNSSLFGPLSVLIGLPLYPASSASSNTDKPPSSAAVPSSTDPSLTLWPTAAPIETKDMLTRKSTTVAPKLRIPIVNPQDLDDSDEEFLMKLATPSTPLELHQDGAKTKVDNAEGRIRLGSITPSISFGHQHQHPVFGYPYHGPAYFPEPHPPAKVTNPYITLAFNPEFKLFGMKIQKQFGLRLGLRIESPNKRFSFLTPLIGGAISPAKPPHDVFHYPFPYHATRSGGGHELGSDSGRTQPHEVQAEGRES